MEKHIADLVEFVRERSTRIFGGPIPSKHPKTGAPLSKAYRGFVASGEVYLGRHDSPMRFHDFLASFMRGKLDAGNFTSFTRMQRGFDRVYERFIEKELKWRPLSEVPEHLRGLLELTRRRMTVLFGDNFPKNHSLSGDDTTENPIRHFVETGEIVGPIDEFLEVLETDLFSVARRWDGTFFERPPTSAAIDAIEQFRTAHAG